MLELGNIWTSIFWVILFNCFASACLLLVLMKYPKYVVIFYNRLMCFRFGMSIKTANLGPNMNISYIERGKPSPDRPSILLVHGFSSSKFSFMSFISHLPRKYHIIVPDLPGHGGSSLKEKEEPNVTTFVQYLKQFAQKVGLSKRKFHIMGTSLGGMLVGVYASKLPDDVLSVTMLCPAGIESDAGNEMIEKAERTGKFILLPETDDQFREMFSNIVHRKIHIPSVFVSGTQQMRNEKNDFYRGFLKTLILPHNKSKLEENLPNIHTPALVVWGREDKILDVCCVETIKTKLPKEPKIIILEEVGHGICFERPKKAAYIYVDFLNSVES